MDTIMEQEDLVEYLAGAFVAGRDGIALDFERREAEAVAAFETKRGRTCSDYALEYISRFYRALRWAYDMGKAAR